MDVAVRLLWGWTPLLHAHDMFGKVGGPWGLGCGAGREGALDRCVGGAGGPWSRGGARARAREAAATRPGPLPAASTPTHALTPPPPGVPGRRRDGADSGIGFEVALRLAERRATVVTGARDLAAGERWAREGQGGPKGLQGLRGGAEHSSPLRSSPVRRVRARPESCCALRGRAGGAAAAIPARPGGGAKPLVWRAGGAPPRRAGAGPEAGAGSGGPGVQGARRGEPGAGTWRGPLPAAAPAPNPAAPSPPQPLRPPPPKKTCAAPCAPFPRSPRALPLGAARADQQRRGQPRGRAAGGGGRLRGGRGGLATGWVGRGWRRRPAHAQHPALAPHNNHTPTALTSLPTPPPAPTRSPPPAGAAGVGQRAALPAAGHRHRRVHVPPGCAGWRGGALAWRSGPGLLLAVWSLLDPRRRLLHPSLTPSGPPFCLAPPSQASCTRPASGRPRRAATPRG
jgi:hypothetical protein